MGSVMFVVLILGSMLIGAGIVSVKYWSLAKEYVNLKEEYDTSVEEDEPEEGRILYVPKDRIREVLVVYDTLLDSTENQSVLRFDLWSLIGEVIPETKVGNWKINTSLIASTCVIELLPPGGE